MNLYDTLLAKALSGSGGGGGGLEFETGEIIPTAGKNSNAFSVPFANQHTTAPGLVLFFDANENASGSGDTQTVFLFVDFKVLFGNQFLYGTRNGALKPGFVRQLYGRNSSTAYAADTYLDYSTLDEGDGSNADAAYYVANDKIIRVGTAGGFILKERKYKWLAIWSLV
jgi:hypothetical protein